MKQQIDLTQVMIQKAAVVGTIVHEVLSISDAFQYAIDLTKKKKLKTMTCPGFTPGDLDMMSMLCKSADLDLLDNALRAKATAIDTSLTWADYGIADTGTLMLASDSEEIRIATMLASIHIAILPISKIRPDTASIEKELNDILKQDKPSYTAFITGASRTADIERVLAIGVHGPVEHHLLLIEEA
jgi:L-lactate dehydrogenase complex protein LldG